jgi:hypothetical protein
MSTNGKTSQAQTVDNDFLISENKLEPHTIVERVVTVQSVDLPGTRSAEVEMIQITEKKIPIAPAASEAKPSK